MVTVRICSKLKTSQKSVVLTNKFRRNFRFFVGVFKQLLHSRLWIWDDYSQLGTMPLVGYLPSHIQCALVDYCFKWITIIVIHLKYFNVSDWLQSPSYFFITNWHLKYMEDTSNIQPCPIDLMVYLLGNKVDRWFTVFA